MAGSRAAGRAGLRGAPFGDEGPAGGRQSGCARFLLAHRDFFATPIWSAFAAGEPGLANVSVVASGSKAHAAWRRRVRALVGDGCAHAAHLCEDFGDFGGLKAATQRRVWSTLFGDRPMPFPNLVALDIDEIRPIRAWPTNPSRSPPG